MRIRNVPQSATAAAPATATDEQLTNNCSVFRRKSTVCEKCGKAKESEYRDAATQDATDSKKKSLS